MAIIVAALAVCALLGLGVLAWFLPSLLTGDSDDDASPSTTSSPSYSASSGGSYDDPGSGASSTAPPDPTASAFDEISSGDCLDVYDTGNGGETSVDWSSDMPSDAVSCDSSDATVRVSQVGTYTSSCKSGTGHSYWSYQPSGGGETKVLCLTRIYRKNYCLLGKQSGSDASPRISLGSMTAVECTDEQVPVPYNQIVQITGVYDAPAGATADDCTRTPGDQTQYWAWKVDDGDTLLCTTVYD
ncbi:LppU/SCO3897 family protein [Streptomyces winkii]|uniref:LppU/SCO3897 family protein n=1 Tax=Streptomyces winkii TaxID=3051178 RepID=UPI0028D86F1C|nr:hypothetical protein [Streptomyces sp. DSM 40971]